MAELESFVVAPPTRFNFNNHNEWPKWSRRWERYMTASGLIKQPDNVQKSSLIYAMGDEAEDIIATFTADVNTYTKLVVALNNHFTPTINVVFERAKFNQRRQQEGESIETFITDLYSLSINCGYTTLRDEFIRDRIIVGMQDIKLSENMQLRADLTLKQATDMAKQSEAVHTQQATMRAETLEASVVNRRKHMTYRKPLSSSSRPHQSSNSNSCCFCARELHPRSACPARNDTCHRCSRKGHWAQACRDPTSTHKRHPVTNIIDELAQQDTDVELFITTVTHGPRTVPPWIVDTCLDKAGPVAFKVDTGADVTVLPEVIYNELREQLPAWSTSSSRLYGASKQQLECIGTFTATIVLQNTRTAQEIYVIRNLDKPLLGRPAIRALGLINSITQVSGLSTNVNKPQTDNANQHEAPGRSESRQNHHC